MATERRDDAVDDVHHVLVVAEGDVHLLDLAGALDVDLVGAVDHDLGDRRVRQQRLDGPEAGDLVGNLVDEPQTLVPGQAEPVVPDVLIDEHGQVAVHRCGIGQVELGGKGVDDVGFKQVPDVPSCGLTRRDPLGLCRRRLGRRVLRRWLRTNGRDFQFTRGGSVFRRLNAFEQRHTAPFPGLIEVLTGT